MTYVPAVLKILLLCTSMSVTGTTQVAGRTVIVEARGFNGVGISDQFGTASISCGKFQVQVTEKTVQVHGRKAVPIPDDCKLVRLACAKGDIHILFDCAANE
jgi:hypothetical protein